MISVVDNYCRLCIKLPFITNVLFVFLSRKTNIYTSTNRQKKQNKKE